MGADAEDMITALTSVGNDHLATFNTEGLWLKDCATFRRAVSWNIVHMASMETEWTVIPYPRAARWHRPPTVDAGEFFISVDGIRPYLRARRSVEQ